jgi:lipopolysaccharide export system protein LptA
MRRLLLALLLLPTPALAQAIDLSRGGPVDVTAAGGFEWREQEQRVIATGSARAVRDNVTVLADRLIALYRKKSGADGGEGGNEIYRLVAEGHVRIVTPTDEAVGDRAVYDIDQAVLVMTGGALKLTTPQQVITARDSLEYWSDRRMAVARGAAVVVTSDGRRISADTLVGYTAPPEAGGTRVAAAPGAAAPASGKLQRVEGFGNVEVRTATDTARGDRGVYVADAGLARLVGHVRVTHGQNQINGPAADVNMNTGVARMIADPGERVQGMIMPNDAQGAAPVPAPARGRKP